MIILSWVLTLGNIHIELQQIRSMVTKCFIIRLLVSLPIKIGDKVKHKMMHKKWYRGFVLPFYYLMFVVYCLLSISSIVFVLKPLSVSLLCVCLFLKKILSFVLRQKFFVTNNQSDEQILPSYTCFLYHI